MSVLKVVKCDFCGAWMEGHRKCLPDGWRNHRNSDACPNCEAPWEKKKADRTERNSAMLQDKKNGMSYAAIARKYGLGVQRTRSIILYYAR